MMHFQIQVIPICDFYLMWYVLNVKKKFFHDFLISQEACKRNNRCAWMTETNVSSLPALLNYHLLNSVQCSEAIMAGTSYETLEGSNIEIGCDGDSLTVNGIKMVLKKDIVTSNGVIHLIDQVLMPDSG